MAETSKENYVVGIDLGGTKILAGLFDSSLECIGTAKVSTKAQRGMETVLSRIERCVRDAVDEADLSLKQVAGVGNVAVLGVHVAELKSKPRHVIGIFVGTGIGGGLIINGELYSGFNHTAGEIGHMVIDVNGPKCGCGSRGCFEAVASRTAIFQRIKEGIKEGEKTLLTDMLGDSLEDLRSGDLRKAIRRGDKFVAKVIEQAAEYIGIGVANLINILGPEVVVLGGGVMEALADEMTATILKTAKDHAMPGTMKNVEIITSKLGDNAGITGAAVLARREIK